jgi:hypothetical protein
MGDVVSNEILFDPNGRITDPRILQQLKATRPLSPAQSIKLSTFFDNADPTHTALRNQLLLSSLVTIVNDRDVLAIAQKKFFLNAKAVDVLEDTCDGVREKDELDARGNVVVEPDGFCESTFFFLRTSSFGFVINSLTDNEQKETSFFIVGITPANILNQ